MESNIIQIGNKRELFWDSFLIDTEKTTAYARLMHMTKKDCRYWFDQGHELYAVSYPCIVKDDKGYKMYYLPWDPVTCRCRVAVLDSKDGLNWTRPKLDIFPHPELADNNIVIDEIADGEFVFYDTNPDCPPEEKYKLIGLCKGPDGRLALWCHISPDGYHFKMSHPMTVCGAFDSMNTVRWEDGQYIAYIRNFHENKNGVIRDLLFDINDKVVLDEVEHLNEQIRDVRVMYSKDFRTWTEPKLIQFDDGMDYPLYTNVVQVYERAPHMLIGFPTRYCERTEWTPNNDQIKSCAIKKATMEREERRGGLAVTDCIFMCSRDGELWHRYNEAFMTPGYETEHNWVYGDCYPAYGLIDSGEENYYIYSKEWHRSYGQPKPLYLYEIRKDGFACYMAGGEEAVLVTKPLEFSGKDLHLNFETSAYGYIYVDVLDEAGNPISGESFEIYGNTIDRKISFADGTDFSAFANKPVRLRFRMRDAKLYSMKFE